MTKKRWQISVISKEDGKFPQKSGPDKPGTECTVSLNGGTGEKRILVRIYADNVSRGLKQAVAVTAYLNGLLESGWTPAEYQGEPGELLVPMRFKVPPISDRAAPRWRVCFAAPWRLCSR
jgi:hypothetical protein